MTTASRHPEDLTAYARGGADPTVRAHLEHCVECREEVEEIRSLDALFHAPELVVEVPAGQWDAIAARIAAERPAPSWLDRLRSLPDRLSAPARPAVLRPVYAGALAAALLVAVTIGGLVYQKHADERRILTLLAGTRAESPAENPFGEYLARQAGANPFERFEANAATNPFAAARR